MVRCQQYVVIACTKVFWRKNNAWQKNKPYIVVTPFSIASLLLYWSLFLRYGLERAIKADGCGSLTIECHGGWAWAASIHRLPMFLSIQCHRSHHGVCRHQPTMRRSVCDLIIFIPQRLPILRTIWPRRILFHLNVPNMTAHSDVHQCVLMMHRQTDD